MGKGDKKSRKGKIWRKSYGNTRPRKKKLEKLKAAKKPAAKKKTAAKKPAKKVATKD